MWCLVCLVVVWFEGVGRREMIFISKSRCFLCVVVVRVISNDRARAVDAFRNSAGGAKWTVKFVGGQRIVEGGVGAAVGIVEEPVRGVADEVSPDDQTGAIDAVRLG